MKSGNVMAISTLVSTLFSHWKQVLYIRLKSVNIPREMFVVSEKVATIHNRKATDTVSDS